MARLPADIVVTLSDLMAAEKSTSVTPDWRPHPHRADHLSCLASLWIDGAIRFGLRLDLHGPRLVRPGRPFYGLTAMMFAASGTETLHLGRLEFDPIGPEHLHRNIRNSAGAPPTITGPHFHPFTENAALGIAALTPSGDLPLAFPFDRAFTTFHDVQDEIRARFTIPGLWLEEPPCSTTLI